MDDVKLIEEVKKRRALWDAHLKAYQNRDIKKKLWGEVAAIMGKSREDVQKKFKNMRDIYRREVKKSTSKSSSETPLVSTVPKWRLYEELTFLKDNLDVRKRRSRIIKSESNDEVENGDSDLSDSIEDSLPDPIATVSINNAIYTPQNLNNSSTEMNQYKRKQSSQPNSNEWKKIKTIDIDTLVQLLDTNSHTKRDDDYNFLFSFYPYIKKMPELTKLQFRVRMQELLYNTMAEIEATNSLSNSLQVQISYETPIEIADSKL